jgi:hypothetical protein
MQSAYYRRALRTGSRRRGVRLERLKTAGRATDPLIWFSESGFIGVYPWPEFFPTATDRHRFLVATRRVRACTHNR